MAAFTHENTDGYTDEMLAELNREWKAIVARDGLTPDMPEWKDGQERLLVDFDQRHPMN